MAINSEMTKNMIFSDLSNKNIIVTGASSDIGMEVVKILQANDVNLALCNIGDMKKELKSLVNNSYHYYNLDLLNRENITNVFEKIFSDFHKIDAMIHIDGGASGCGDILDITDEMLIKDVELNLYGTFFCMKNVLSNMVQHNVGTIVNISTINALTGIGESSYSAAKAGVESLTRTCAVRYGRFGIRCNSIALGTVKTNHPNWQTRLKDDPNVFDKISSKIPRKTVGKPEEAANLAVFFASDASSLVNGATIIADGGWSIACGTISHIIDKNWWE